MAARTADAVAESGAAWDLPFAGRRPVDLDKGMHGTAIR